MNLGRLEGHFSRLIDDKQHSILLLNDKYEELDSALQELASIVRDVKKSFYTAQRTLICLAGEARVALPSDFSGQLVMVPGLSYAPEFYFYSRNKSGPGTPSTYRVEGNDILLLPTPSSDFEFNLVYYRSPAGLENAADTVDFPKGFEMLIVYKAMIRSALLTGVSTRSAHVEHDKLLRKFRKNPSDQTTQPRTTRRVRRRRSSNPYVPNF